MNIEIAEYSASLMLPSLDAEAVHQTERAAQETLSGLAVSIGPHHLEFDYTGRDAGRKVVTFLCRVAPLIGEADGEVECRLTTDSDENRFEFYTIRQSRLYRQEAELVRQPLTEVRSETEALERLPVLAH